MSHTPVRASVVSRLEHLKKLVDEFVPIMFGGTSRAKELSDQIARSYGAVQDVYRRYAGEQNVVVEEGRRRSVFPNYFEAGFFSGRTFDTHKGVRELERVLGQIEAWDGDDLVQVPAGPMESVWLLLHHRVRAIAEPRFRAGHYADSVEAAIKELVETLRTRVLQQGGPELDGEPLMQSAFSVDNPWVFLADLNSKSGKSIQRGYMQIFTGAIAAIRNPKAHGNINITSQRAIHLLFFVSTLWHTLDEGHNRQSTQALNAQSLR